MASHPRDEWTDLVRQYAARLGARLVRRFWGPRVRRAFQAGVLAVLVVLGATLVGCFALAAWYSWRAHDRSGVPAKRVPYRWEGQPVYRQAGGPAAEQPLVPMTEDQFRAWEDNQDASRRWARRAAVYYFFPTVALAVLLAARANRSTLTARPAPAPAGSSPGCGSGACHPAGP